MTSPLLRTKLYVHPTRPELVPRPRLIDRLNEGMARKLIVISAPAGFGKTTLLGEWVGRNELPAAWVSLDESDNDPPRFLTYVVAHRFCWTVATMLATSETFEESLVITRLGWKRARRVAARRALWR